MQARRVASALPLLLPTAAFAHTGIGPHTHSAFGSGFLHPMLGADHMLTMVAVGLFAAMTGSRARWAYPCSFVGAMIVGGFLGFEGAALPVIEPTILASVVVLGAAIAFALRPPLALACGVIAVFGMAHGYAHGLEAPGLGGLPYAAGFVVATSMLHGVGLGLGFGVGSLGRPALARAMGALACLGGVALILS
ncbi:MAG: HupE/UreJ family protein [Amaricoccus sp.]